MAGQNKKEEESAWVTWAQETDGFIATMIIFGLIVAAAIFFAYIGIGSHQIYNNAPYKVDADCTLIKIDKYEKEQEVYDDYYKDEPEHIRKQHMKTEKYNLYVLEWEYYLDDKRMTFTTTEKYATTHKVGDKMDQKMYSEDGVEYKRAGFSGFTDFLLGVCFLTAGLFSYFIIGTILMRIKLAKGGKLVKKKKGKKKQNTKK